MMYLVDTLFLLVGREHVHPFTEDPKVGGSETQW